MDLAHRGIIPPREWHHNPTLRDNHDWTVAMWLAYRGIIPPKEW